MDSEGQEQPNPNRRPGELRRNISGNEFNAEKERKISESDSDPYRKPRTSSFKDADQFVYRAGAFVRDDSDDESQSRSGSGSMPNFRNAIKAQLQKTQDEMPKGPMREMMETYKPHILTRRRQLIEDCVRDLRLNNDHIHIVEQEMRKAIQKGLQSGEDHFESSVKCFPTYVRSLPNGKERGKFLSLDLGGTNFRVIVMELTEESEFIMDNKVYAIPQDIMIGTGDALFDHIAECLADFVYSREIQNQILPLGFTFSFPCEQEGLAKAKLVKWTKGFSCSGVEGQDVVQHLQAAITRRGDVRIEVCAILNDTTGCLMSSAWRDDRCRVGLILGTGTNACYLEEIADIHTIDQNEFKGQKHMVVNTEWGAFGENGELDFIRTKWDYNVDKFSVNPTQHIFEKMISGMYMGELIRQVLVDLMKDDLLFFNCNRERLFERGAFYTRFASEIESDPVGDYTRARMVMEELDIDPDEVTAEDYSSLRYICEVVSRRASFMASAGITALLKKMDYKNVVIAIDGSLFRHHPHFKNVMHSRISQLMGIDYTFELLLSEDGSGRGAALVAAVLKRDDNNEEQDITNGN